MKKFFKSRVVRILAIGFLIGGALIAIDEFLIKPNFKKSGQAELYNGPVSIEKDKVYFTELQFSETSFDFGNAKEGDTLKHDFVVKNTGSEPLIIYRSSGSCDCIAVDYPKDMVAPGGEAVVRSYFVTKGRKGPQTRNLVLTCNTEPADITLTIKANVQ